MNIISEQRFEELTSKFMSLDPIIVLGDVGIDKYTFGNVRRISPEAPVPVLEVTKEWSELGLAANISNNLNTLEIKSSLCGVIGGDKYANDFEELMKSKGLQTDGLVRDSKRSTIYKERVLTESQQVCRVDYESVVNLDNEVENSVLDRACNLIDSHGALILEDYGKGTITQTLTSRLVDKFKEAGKLVTLDPSRTTPPEYYKGVTLLKPNLLEAQLMAQSLGYVYENSREKIGEILVDKLNLTMLVITLGSEGMALWDTRSDGKMKIIPTLATEVFDVSGAGDTAISLITAGIMAGGTLEEAAWLGNCASGVVVAKKGTATVNISELKNFHKRIVKKFK